MNQLPDFAGAAIAGGIVCAVAGWALIEGVIWIGTHLIIGWAA